MDPIRIQYSELQMDASWIQNGFNEHSIWTTFGLYMDSIWIQDVDSIWIQYGFNIGSMIEDMDSIWTQEMDPIWIQCGLNLNSM